MIHQQYTLFLVALQFYTRIPVPAWVPYHPEDLSKATRFLPLVGWLVGIVTAGVWLVLEPLTNGHVALLLAMSASVLLTGAFHEDGFADACDGFGGGWTRDKILLIMKDSRIGTYGSIGLLLLLALKFASLQLLSEKMGGDSVLIVFNLLAAHSLSRLMAALLIFTLPYARETDDSKSKPVATAAGFSTISIALLLALLPLLGLCYFSGTLWGMAVLSGLGLVTYGMGRYYKKWIGGYTGDCLGAVQQVTEVVFYLFISIVWKFI
ncbi:adenosylcobinamide-GDP ribazoletransferase [Dyadobacter jejuensis]|uniref:Adenosylcobinamide-GDP ribazoletransferase n=1 Tax=Dyadobacter jejuensis TaxID=1082580 RepID=A0A316ADJ6_9BACT|nr:adenosylcobinamide-GDP ribazoletransferase [Dyadobacter jejuensis]PWJ55040.1 adenosylcobinamide-GDP ribazoletransferase [Dyadobacter jejuensis]